MTKRLFDIVVSMLGLMVLAPLFPIIALLIKLDSRGPVIYRQWRVGRDQRPFQIFKFRTMVDAAQVQGTAITVASDRRTTRLGRILRRFEFDELPTLLNVLKGEMSIVGPRPEVPRYLTYYTDEQRRVFSVRPGLTDPGTLVFRNEAVQLVGEDPEEVYILRILPHKLALNLQYIEKQSFLYDLGIILRTLAMILFHPKGRLSESPIPREDP